jgi:hypothetical protein
MTFVLVFDSRSKEVFEDPGKDVFYVHGGLEPSVPSQRSVTKDPHMENGDMLLGNQTNLNTISNGTVQTIADLFGRHASRAFLKSGITR